MYELLRHEREHGNILWVMGPACTFDADARSAFAALVREGFVDGVLGGNALATHDLEAGCRAPPWARTSTPSAASPTATTTTSTPSTTSAAWGPSRPLWTPAR